jgi:hypothetical protein
MYAWIWRRLPGRPRVKAAWAALLVLALIALLWFLVFPWAAVHLPIAPA